MTAGAPAAARGGWGVAALVGVSVGVAAAWSLPAAAGLLLVAALAYAFARSGVRSEVVVAAFWIAFTLYETVFASTTISGFFYPFYLAFVASIVVSLLRDGLRMHVPLVLSYVAFLLVVMVSFVGFERPITFDVVQRLVAYLFGGVVLLQVRSRRGPWAIATAAVVASVAISGWVIASSIRGGFQYRGDVDVDQNVVAFFIGFGVIIAACLCLDAIGRRRSYGALLLPAAVLGVTIYASLLLASRGMALALAVALVAVSVGTILREPRALRFALVLVVLAGGAMALPGGQGLLERFEGERVESGGSRLPIWEATLEAYAAGDLGELVLGHGWGASRAFVARDVGSVASTHNAWIQMLYEFGAVGLALFAWLHVHLLLRARTRAAPLGPIMAGLTWFLIGANFSTNSPDGFMYWTALALAMAIGTWAPEVPRAAPPEREEPSLAAAHGRLAAP